MRSLFSVRPSKATLQDLYEELGYYFSQGDTLQSVWANFEDKSTLRATRRLAGNIEKKLDSGTSLGAAINDICGGQEPMVGALLEGQTNPSVLARCFEVLSDIGLRSNDLRLELQGVVWNSLVPLAIVFITTALLLIFVIPQMAALFQGFGADLPALTQQVVVLSRLPITEILVGLGLVAFVLSMLAKGVPEIRALRDQAVIAIPIMGGFKQQLEIDKYAYIVTAVHSLELGKTDDEVQQIAAEQVENSYLRQQLMQESKGQTLQTAITESEVLPIKFRRLVRNLDFEQNIHSELLKYFERSQTFLADRAQRISGLLAVFSRVVFIAIVVILVIAMYLPIFQMGAVI